MPVALKRRRIADVVPDMTAWCRRIIALAVALSLLLGLLSLGPAVGASASGVESPCGNEALRSALGSLGLPECRAYEMVSPPYKEGYPMLKSSYSSDGNRAILYSLGNLAGTSGAGETAVEGDMYLDERGSTGWHIAPLNGPSSEFVGEIPVASEVNSGATLWKQHLLGQSAFNIGLYMRSRAGVFSFVGPLTLPLEAEEEPTDAIDTSKKRFDRPVAATTDYRHVVLYAVAPEDYWSFDHTVGDNGSLYEYSGTNNQEPILIGVNGAKGSTELIGPCGTELGGSGSTYNALSSEGETIFFTVFPGCGGPESTEIYARLHGSLISPMAAKTEDISASECTSACGSTVSGKNFEGASENGQRVFFTSTQKLTNDAVDGTASGDAAEGEGCAATEGAGGCDLYEYDFARHEGSRLSLVAGGEVSGVLGVAEDGSRIYFVSKNAIASAGFDNLGRSPEAGQPNLYVYDIQNKSTAFITALTGAEDAADWSRRLVQRPIEVGGEDGQFLLFTSSALSVTSDDGSDQEQLFEYKAENGVERAELVRITKGEDGFNNNGNDVAVGIEPGSIRNVDALLGGTGTDFKSTTNQLNLAVDGKTVSFESPSQLSPRAASAADGCRNIYDVHTDGALAEGQVHLISDGRDTQLYKGSGCGPRFVGLDANGENILFATSDPMAPGDVDGVQRDVYDARVDGGFPAAESGLCGSCEGPSTIGSALPVLGSFSQPGEAPLRTTTVPKKAAVKKRNSGSSSGKLHKALQACKAKQRKVRAACERRAHIRYGSTKSSRRG